MGGMNNGSDDLSALAEKCLRKPISLRNSRGELERWLNTGWSSRGQGFDSHYPHSGSQPSVTSAPGKSDVPFWPPQTPGTPGVHKHTCRQNTCTDKKKKKKQRTVKLHITCDLPHKEKRLRRRIASMSEAASESHSLPRSSL